MTESRTGINKKNDWRAVMASIAEEASQEADLPAQPVSGWDGEGLRWVWSIFPSENHVEEVILRAYPDAYSAGIQAEVLAVARTYDRPLLWSATTFSTHVRLEAFEEGSGDLAEFQEELPRHLSHAWEKAHGSSQELDRLYDEKQRRDEKLYEQIAHLMIDEQRKQSVNLRGHNLSGHNLSGHNLSGQYLREANLRGANLREANLREANLSGAGLSGADLSGAHLAGTHLSGANLSKANLWWANFSEADLRGADLTEADLTEADLSEADLSEASLRRADLRGTNLSKTNLSKAHLGEANLLRSEVTDEQLGSAHSLRGTTMPDGSTHE